MIFLALFWRIPLQNGKKKITKKNLALAHNSLKKKCKIPLCSKKSNSMKTSPYLQVGAVWKRHYNVNPFLRKKNMKLPYSIAISCDFHVFSKYPYLSRFTFYQKVKNWLYNTLAITFFWLIANLHFKISNLQKIAMNDTCTCDLNVTSIENLWFWAKFEENWKGYPYRK